MGLSHRPPNWAYSVHGTGNKIPQISYLVKTLLPLESSASKINEYLPPPLIRGLNWTRTHRKAIPVFWMATEILELEMNAVRVLYLQGARAITHQTLHCTLRTRYTEKIMGWNPPVNARFYQRLERVIYSKIKFPILINFAKECVILMLSTQNNSYRAIDPFVSYLKL